MFLRRKKPNVVVRVGNFFWPSTGWGRSTRYIFHRVARIPGSAYSIAAGFACGAAISFTPFVGLHFVFAALLALVMRANVISSAIGTAVGNPWTFPFIWAWVYNLGLWMGAMGDDVAQENLPFASIFADAMEALLRMDIAYLIDVVFPVFWPMLVGSLPTAVVAWLVFYIALRPLVAGYQIQRVHRRHRKSQLRQQALEEKMNAREGEAS